MSLAPETFIMVGTIEDTVKDIVRKLNFVFANLTAGESIDLGNAKIGTANIDFGINSSQVKASNIPIVDVDSVYTSQQVEDALSEVMQTVLNQTLAEHVFAKVTISNPPTFTVDVSEIGTLPISATYSQTEIKSLRDSCEKLSSDCRVLRNKVLELTETLRGYGLT